MGIRVVMDGGTEMGWTPGTGMIGPDNDREEDRA
jgi:hypothetical protein